MNNVAPVLVEFTEEKERYLAHFQIFQRIYLENVAKHTNDVFAIYSRIMLLGPKTKISKASSQERCEQQLQGGVDEEGDDVAGAEAVSVDYNYNKKQPGAFPYFILLSN